MNRSYSILILLAFAASLLGQGPPPGKGPDNKNQKWIVKPDTVFFIKTGNETTLMRTVNVHRTGPPSGGAVTITVQVTNVSGGAWLAAGSVVNDKLTLTATPGTLGPGTYEAKVTVTPAGSPPQTIEAFLRIGAAPSSPASAFVRPSSLKFEMKQGGANPDPRVLTVSSPTGNAATFAWAATRTVTTPPAGTWLQISNTISGNGPGQITVSVNGATLGVGEYSGKVTVTSGASSVDIPVTLDVDNPGSEQGEESRLLVVNPKALNFIVHPGAPPPGPKTVDVKTTRSTPVSWTAVVESTGGWLLPPSPAGGSTPGKIQVSVNPGALARGHYEGKLKVTSGAVTETVRVFLRIVGKPDDNPNVTKPTGKSSSAIHISPPVLEFSSGGNNAAVTAGAVKLDSKTTGLSFSATGSTARGGAWLNLLNTSGAVPGTLNVSVTPGSLAAGIYTGLITFSITGPVTEQRHVLVILRIGAPGEAARLKVKPGGVAFQAKAGGANPAVASVQLQVEGAASAAYASTIQYVNGSSWLLVAPATDTAPKTLTVTPNITGLAVGVYRASVVFQATGSPGALPATLSVVLAVTATGSPLSEDGAALSATPLGFFVEPAPDFLATLNTPLPVQVALFYPDGRAAEGVQLQIVSSGAEPALWLDEIGGGLYNGVFRPLGGGPMSLAGTAIDSTGAIVAEFSLGGDVESSDDMTPVIFQEGIVNTASYTPGAAPVAPGSIVSLFGRELVDTTSVAGSLPLPRELSGVRVLVGGIEAPLVAVVSGDNFDQINFQVPLELAGLTHADVVVLSNGHYSDAEGLTLAPSVPALFTLNQSGTGGAAALRSDFSLITDQRPARAGDTILLFGTGLGAVTPPPNTGEPPAGLTSLAGNLQVTIGGQPARVRFAGLAPGFVGLYQINADVPAGVTGQPEIRLVVDGISSAEGVVTNVR